MDGIIHRTLGLKSRLTSSLTLRLQLRRTLRLTRVAMLPLKICLFVVAPLCAGLSAPLAQAAALDQFNNFVATTRAAEGEFTQRQIKIPRAQDPAKPDQPREKVKISNQASGHFVFARPGKFIWSYQKPYDQLLQADGEKLYIYDKDLNQVTIKKLGTALSSSPAAILFGSNDLEKNFSLRDAGQRDGLDWLEAVPKDKDSTFTQIGIGMQDGLPRAMELRDNFGQMTIITLSKVEKNPTLKTSEFTFVTPAGADVFNP